MDDPSTVKGARPVWTLDSSDTFRLFDPSGNEVRLPTWKTEALLTMLSSAGERGIPKSTAAGRLWPGQDAIKAGANLRQTVRRLRAAIGNDSVLTAWDSIRLAPDFDIRTESGSAATQMEAAIRRQSPTQALLQVVNWALDFDPTRAVDLLKSNHDIALEFAPVDVRALANRLLSAFRPSEPQFGWALYFLGNAQFQTATFEEITRTFTSSMRYGRQFGDEELTSQSVVFLCATAFCHGQRKYSRKAVAQLNEVFGKHRRVEMQRVVSATSAQLSLMEGRVSDAIKFLRNAVDLSSDWPQDHAHLEAQRALCLATVGQTSTATEILEDLREFSESSDFHRLHGHIGLAQQMILLRDRQFDALGKVSAVLIRNASASGATQVELSAREILAAGTWAAGDRPQAEEEWKAATALRRKICLAPTEWDRARLTELPLAAELFLPS